MLSFFIVEVNPFNARQKLREILDTFMQNFAR